MQSSSGNLLSKLNISERTCAFALGVLFLVVGIAGFIPGLTSFVDLSTSSSNLHSLAFDDGYGYVLGLFPTNFLHNAVHIAVGVLGIAASTSLSGAIVYNQAFAILYILIALMGLLPFTNTTFGTMPIFGNNVWLNALTAIIAGYVGFVKPAAVKDKLQNPGASSSSI